MHSNNFPDFATLAKIALCLPILSIPHDCGFSLQNRIKPCYRSQLTARNLQCLMRTYTEGPSFDYEFNYAPARAKLREIKQE